MYKLILKLYEHGKKGANPPPLFFYLSPLTIKNLEKVPPPPSIRTRPPLLFATSEYFVWANVKN